MVIFLFLFWWRSRSNVSVSIPVPWSHSVIGLFIKLIRSPSPVNKLSLILHFSASTEYRNIEVRGAKSNQPTHLSVSVCGIDVASQQLSPQVRQNPFIRKLLTSAATMPIMFLLITFNIITDQSLCCMEKNLDLGSTRAPLYFSPEII